MGEKKLVRDYDFPSNSNTKKVKLVESEEEVKKLEPIVKGQVIRKKKSFWQKASETFFGDDTKSVGDYILYDVLIPALKTTLNDMVSGGVEMLLFGERRRGGKSSLYRDRDKTYVPYNRISRRDDDSIDRRYLSNTARSRHDFDDIIIESRGEAEDVLSHLVMLVDDYKVASVADYYDLLGIEANYTDNKYGWTNLRDAYVERVRQGYSIRLPNPREIN